MEKALILDDKGVLFCPSFRYYSQFRDGIMHNLDTQLSDVVI